MRRLVICTNAAMAVLYADGAIFSGMSQATDFAAPHAAPHAAPMYRTSGALQGERLLQVCIGGSIVLHALAMLYASRVEPPVAPPSKFTATLRAAPAPKPSAPEPLAAKPEPVTPKLETPPPPPVVTRAPPVPMTESNAERALVKNVAPIPAPAPAAAPAPEPSTPASAPVDAKAAPVSDAPKAAPAAPPTSSNDPSDKDLINGYQSQLVPVVEKYRRYPNDAVQNNWDGRVLVSIRIGSDGKMMGAPEITTSSGHEILDAEARIALNKAKPFVPIPNGLKGKEFVARMWIVFELTRK